MPLEIQIDVYFLAIDELGAMPCVMPYPLREAVELVTAVDIQFVVQLTSFWKHLKHGFLWMNPVRLIAQDKALHQFLTTDDDPFQVVDQLVFEEGELVRTERAK